MTPILEVKSLSKTFGSVTAAADINVSVKVGERVGLIGTNGAGKTTFVNMVTGYIKPDRGTILLQGRDITGQSPRYITRAGVCRSFQIPQLFLGLTAEENLVVAIGIATGRALAPHASPDAPDTRGAVEDLLSRFRLGEYRHRVVSELPGGVRKLLDIAVAVTRKPKLLLLDEPTSGVASEQKFALMDIVMEALPDDVTVLFVEHDMDIVSRYSDRVLAFYDGRIISDAHPSVVLSDPQVKSYITGAAN
ncbi:MAG: ABC transporter ATP-binding protein [Variibacter sp.]|nr:ABC transporter ATP-binding protein [Variibacter sp.]